MRPAMLILVMGLVGCADPVYVSRQSNWDVCRLTMGGPHAAAAEAEARARNLDCAPLYPSISADQAARSAAALQYMQMMRPQPLQMPQIPQTTTCRSRIVGNQVYTDCN